FSGYDDGYALTSPVGAFPEGASAYGAFDMLGNVFQWVQDAEVQRFYQNGPKNDPVAEEKGSMMRLERGAAFNSFPPNVRTSYRLPKEAFYKGEDTGFRIALSGRYR